MKRLPGQVRLFSRVWIQRVSSAYCSACGVGQLTTAGKEKLNRAIEMTRSVLGMGDDPPEPMLQFEDTDGMIFQVELKRANG